MLNITGGISFTRLNKNQTVRFKKGTLSVMQTQPDTFNGKSLEKPESSTLQKLEVFFGRKTQPVKQKELPEIGPHGVAKNQYRNVFGEAVVGLPNPNLKEDLLSLKKISDINVAVKRTSSFSSYMLKMVGFITPNGHEWMPNALTNLLYATQGSKIPDEKLINPARELWSLMAIADNYWTSDHFMTYLNTMEPSLARNATIQALEEIRESNNKQEQVSFAGRGKKPRPPLVSSLREVPELLNGAYSAKHLSQTTDDSEYRLTLEHVYPQSLGGLDNDFNFILASGKENNLRKNAPLVRFLKGYSRP